MAIRCHCCNKVFRNINERRKHALSQTVCTRPDLLKARQLGKITHHYQVLRQLEKQQRPRKHGERHDS